MFGFTRWRFARGVRRGVAAIGLAALAASAGGCSSTGARNDELSYPHTDPQQIQTYVGEENRIAHSNISHQSPDDVLFASAPRTIADRRNDVVRELTLGECIHIAMINNKIVQTATQGIGQKGIYSNPDNIPSIYDQAIGETGVLFGRRGVEAALSDFDTTLRTTMTWGRSSLPINNRFFPPPFPQPLQSNVTETWNTNTTLSKQFATGASLQFFQNLSYLGTNSPNVGLSSSFTGQNGFQFRQPLLAGSGTDFTRIAGPVNPNFGAITGVSQGVLIARINSDISLAQFEASVRDSIRDLQKAYWDLYLSYRNYETSVVAHRSAFQTWREANIKLEVGTLKAADEAQAREQFHTTQSTVEQNLNSLYKAETALRRLMGLQINDCEIIRPADSPLFGEFLPDWRASMAEALTRRVELRRQKWNIKSLQLQLQAACSLTRPQLDLIAGATQDGLANHLLGGENDLIPRIWGGRHGSWDLGFEYSVPIGFRSAHSQVRNYELRIAKARAVLDQTEREISHDVSTAVQDLIASYTSAATTEDRLIAARHRVELLDLEREEGTTTLDMVLRAQTALAQAEQAYYARIVDFSKAMIDFEFSKGSLLPSSGVQLAEGGWDACAYQDALRRAMERTYAYENVHLEQKPPAFARSQPVPISEVKPAICDADGFEILNSKGEPEYRFGGEDDFSYEELSGPDDQPLGFDGLPIEVAPETPDFDPLDWPRTESPDYEPMDEFRTEPGDPLLPAPSSDDLMPLDTTWFDDFPSRSVSVQRKPLVPQLPEPAPRMAEPVAQQPQFGERASQPAVPQTPAPQKPQPFLNVTGNGSTTGGFGKAELGIRRATRTKVTPVQREAVRRAVIQSNRSNKSDSHFSNGSLSDDGAGWQSLPGPFYPASNRRSLSESVNAIGGRGSRTPVKFGDLFEGTKE